MAITVNYTCLQCVVYREAKKRKKQNTNFIVEDRYIATLGEIKMLIPMAEIIVGVVHFKKKP